METKKQDYKKLLGYIKHNDLEHKTFNKTFNRICFNNEEYEVVVSCFNNEEYEAVVSDDILNKVNKKKVVVSDDIFDNVFCISIYEKKTETFIVIAVKKTMEEVLELIDANVFGVK